MNDTTSTGPLYPNVEVQLSGRDGNAFAIIGAFTAEVDNVGSYDGLLQLAMRTVSVA